MGNKKMPVSLSYTLLTLVTKRPDHTCMTLPSPSSPLLAAKHVSVYWSGCTTHDDFTEWNRSRLKVITTPLFLQQAPKRCLTSCRIFNVA